MNLNLLFVAVISCWYSLPPSTMVDGVMADDDDDRFGKPFKALGPRITRRSSTYIVTKISNSNDMAAGKNPDNLIVSVKATTADALPYDVESEQQSSNNGAAPGTAVDVTLAEHFTTTTTTKAIKTGTKRSTSVPTQTAEAAAGSSSGRQDRNNMIHVISVILIIVLLMTFLLTWILWIMDRRRYKPDLQSAETYIIDGGIAKPYYVDEEGKAYSTEMTPISSIQSPNSLTL